MIQALRLGLLAALLAACASSIPLSEVRVGATVVYLLTPSAQSAQALCGRLGLDTARLMAQANSGLSHGERFRLPQVVGCHAGGTGRHVIVCPVGDPLCLAHEERHMREGAWHP